MSNLGVVCRVLLGNDVETFRTELIPPVSHTAVGYKLYLLILSGGFYNLGSQGKSTHHKHLHDGNIIFDGVNNGLVRR